jgi:hypothetical protein
MAIWSVATGDAVSSSPRGANNPIRLVEHSFNALNLGSEGCLDLVQRQLLPQSHLVKTHRLASHTRYVIAQIYVQIAFDIGV